MNINDIYAAKKRLDAYLMITPLLYSPLLQKELHKQIWLKLETQQPTGSFKPRPAFNSILTQLEQAKKRGVIASSSGNFAQGVAYAARELGLPATIVMMQKTSPFKIERTKQLGAKVVLCGDTHEDRVNTTEKLQKESGALLVHPYDSEETIAGDATIGLELSEQLGEILNEMCVLVPVSGGGLLAGIAFALKTLYPRCQVIGVQPAANASLAKSLQAGQCVNVGPVETIADALVASEPGQKPFALIREYVDDILLVQEKEIESATRYLIEHHKLVVETGGAVGIAALRSGKVTAEKCICIISGGNINLWGNH